MYYMVLTWREIAWDGGGDKSKFSGVGVGTRLWRDVVVV